MDYVGVLRILRYLKEELVWAMDKQLRIVSNMWLELQKPNTDAHNGKEHFSSPIDSSINKLINYHNTTAKS